MFFVLFNFDLVFSILKTIQNFCILSLTRNPKKKRKKGKVQAFFIAFVKAKINYPVKTVSRQETA